MNSASPETQMESLLASLPPDISPRLGRRLASAPWTARGIKRRQTVAVLYVTVILLIAFLVLTPQGRAFAQTIFKFFTATDQASIPLSTEEINTFFATPPARALTLVQVMPFLDPCSSSDATGIYKCEVQNMEKQLNVDLKEFPTTPSGWTFAKVQFYSEVPPDVLATYPSAWSTTYSVVEISYRNSGGALHFNQGIGDFPPDSDWDRVPTSAIQPITVGKYNGEYVNGYFGLRNGDTQLTWQIGGEQRIRWMEGERRFEILEFAGPGTSGYFDKQALMSLATDMVYQSNPSEKTTNVDLGFILNTSLAENICKCSILEPTLLPQGMKFNYARYDPEWKSITLNYGYRALRIVQTPLESAMITNLDSYNNVETVTVGDALGQYGVSPAQKTIWDSATPPAFPVNNSYSVLLWKKDGMIFQIYFDQSFSNGGQLTKEQMIEIAESLQ